MQQPTGKKKNKHSIQNRIRIKRRKKCTQKRVRINYLWSYIHWHNNTHATNIISPVALMRQTKEYRRSFWLWFLVWFFVVCTCPMTVLHWQRRVIWLWLFWSDQLIELTAPTPSMHISDSKMVKCAHSCDLKFWDSLVHCMYRFSFSFSFSLFVCFSPFCCSFNSIRFDGMVLVLLMFSCFVYLFCLFSPSFHRTIYTIFVVVDFRAPTSVRTQTRQFLLLHFGCSSVLVAPLF